MQTFLSRFGEKIIGPLSGFDRLVLRGILRQLCHVDGFRAFLNHRRVLLKDATAYFKDSTAQIKAHCEQLAKERERPFEYIGSSQVRKDERAQEILRENPVDNGVSSSSRRISRRPHGHTGDTLTIRPRSGPRRSRAGRESAAPSRR